MNTTQTTPPTESTSRRRRLRVPRPVAVIAAAVLGLGVLGGAVGVTLGGIGAVVAAHEHGDHHGPGRGLDDVGRDRH